MSKSPRIFQYFHDVGNEDAHTLSGFTYSLTFIISYFVDVMLKRAVQVGELHFDNIKLEKKLGEVRIGIVEKLSP